ncbi:MAG: purine-nucleoside phosphorylase [Helicobacteraceae bacterium]|jgi:purine-nucleoside phosphorylase|nr:purine-nucleoside phosphorylase [Helicobacteraceae bacterium]
MIVCAGKSERFDFALPIGVGLINAAINLTELCVMERPKYLLFVGTAGSYDTDLAHLEIVTSEGAANIELSFIMGKSYTPLENILISPGGLVAHQTIVNSSNYITTDAEIAKEMKRHKIGLENMEFFSVISVANEFGVSAGGVFCVTNHAVADAHDQYNRNHAAALDKLDRYMKKFVLPSLRGEGDE